MSIFGSLMGDFDDDLFMGNQMNAMNMQMRSMNRLMNSLMPDPFNMLAPFDPGFQQNQMMERGNPHSNPMGGLFGFPAIPNINRLLSADIGTPAGASYCSSSVITMSSGPDGRPQIYQATTSTKAGPGGIRETRKTVQDSTRGLKKMAIGHHIGERSHIIEKEQDLRSGQMEERQEFINLDEDEAEDFDREFSNRARGRRQAETLSIEPADDDDERPRHHRHLASSGGHHRRQLPALPAPPQQNHSSSPTPTPTPTPTSTPTPLPNAQSARPSSPLSAHASRANAVASSAAIAAAALNNNNNYLSTTPRRAYRSHLTGASARRPLRTPTSSPLATTPTNHSHSTATTTSVHPHPYNASAARRNYRSKHSKLHQQPHSQLTITEITDDEPEPTPAAAAAAPAPAVSAAKSKH